MSKLTGINTAAELLQTYIDEIDARLSKEGDNVERSLLIGRKLGAIDFFEKMCGGSLKDSLVKLEAAKKSLKQP